MPDAASQPEAQARRCIDALLEASGWTVQDRSAVNLSAGTGVALRELPTASGEADYGLFLGNELVGVVEAKKVGDTLGGVEAQTLAYASKTLPGLQVPIQPLPFRYESTGVETFFTNGLDPDPTARRVYSFHRPETLGAWLAAEVRRRSGKADAPTAPTLKGRMRLAQQLNRAGMWPAQIRAVENLEASIRDGRLRALIQMATGGGKTFTAISAGYRLISQGGARRVLFLVDRSNLGRQALKEFQAYSAPDDGRKFHELYNVVHLSNNRIDPVNKVVITTIQRLYSILKGEPEFDAALEEESAFDGHGAALVLGLQPVVYNAQIPPEFFDVIVVDECHRSIYNLWSQVIDYFDASILGLTATPGGHTYAYFHQNVVSEYRHEEAVRDSDATATASTRNPINRWRWQRRSAVRVWFGTKPWKRAVSFTPQARRPANPCWRSSASPRPSKPLKGSGCKGPSNVVLQQSVRDIEWSGALPSDPSSVTVIRDASGRYFASFVVEVEPTPLPANGKALGIDLGLASLAVTSDGEKIAPPKFLRSALKRLRRLQRHLKHKQKGSNRLATARRQVAKLHATIADKRLDFLHQLSTRIIRENQTVVLEDLNVSGMLKNKQLARSIADAGWRQFRTLLEAKAEQYGRQVVVINRWLPTSQGCSTCAHHDGKKELSIREWQCPSCGAVHDRDINAALNILAAGLAESRNGRGAAHKSTALVAAGWETPTHPIADTSPWAA